MLPKRPSPTAPNSPPTFPASPLAAPVVSSMTASMAAVPFETLRAATVAWLVAGSPFFWAPPLWILALMAPHRPRGGAEGSAVPPPSSG